MIYISLVQIANLACSERMHSLYSTVDTKLRLAPYLIKTVVQAANTAVLGYLGLTRFISLDPMFICICNKKSNIN